MVIPAHAPSKTRNLYERGFIRSPRERRTALCGPPQENTPSAAGKRPELMKHSPTDSYLWRKGNGTSISPGTRDGHAHIAPEGTDCSCAESDTYIMPTITAGRLD